MTVWGGYESHLRVGVNYSFSTPSHSSTSVTLTVTYYAGLDTGYTTSYSDDQTLNLSGAITGSIGFHNGLSGRGDQMTIGTRSTSVPIAYGTSPAVTFGATISGAFNGATPSVSVTVRPPARPAAAPDAPGTPSVSSVSATGATASWSTPNNQGASLTQYQIQYATDSGFSNVVFSATAGWATTNTTTSLTRATDYYVRVRAGNSVGWSGWSGAAPFSTPHTAPGAPGTPSAGSLTSSSVTLTWAAPSDNGGDGPAAYWLQVAKDSGFVSLVHDDQDVAWATSQSYSDLTRTTTYYARIKAANSMGYGNWSATTSFATSPTVPDAPPAPTVTNISPVAADFAWAVPTSGGSAITGYTLQISSLADFSAAVLTGTYGPSTTSAPAPGALVPGTTYYARVRASNANGDGAWSPAATFQTLPSVYIGNGTAWVMALAWIGDGTTWRHAVIKVGDGTAWH